MIITKNQHDSLGNPDGYWERYHANGQIQCKGNYINGKRNGYWEWYYYNGRLGYKGSYLNGRRNGYWEEYNRDGELKESIFYDRN